MPSLLMSVQIFHSSTGKYFVDELPSAAPSASAEPSSTPSNVPAVPSAQFLGSISGNIGEDMNSNNDADEDLVDVLIALDDGDNNVVATTATNNGGNYVFYDLSDGRYKVIETNLAEVSVGGEG